jgi:hypothetical protein
MNQQVSQSYLQDIFKLYVKMLIVAGDTENCMINGEKGKNMTSYLLSFYIDSN